MPLGLFDTASLVALIPSLIVGRSFLLDTFFPDMEESDDETIMIDVEKNRRRLAPFCSPLVEGKLVEGVGFETRTFKPAYIKDKRAPDLLKPIRRAIGERLTGGNLTPAEREELNLVREMADQVAMINRRMEWMAASALRTGTVTVAGEGYPTTVVSFLRDPSLTVALTGSARWGSESVSPGQNIDTWAMQILQQSGAVVTDVVFTPGAWRPFSADRDVKAAIQSPNNNDVSISLGGGVVQGAQFKGTWGNYRLWVYNDWYVDPVSDTEQPMWPDGTVVLVATAELRGVRKFGLIKDPRFNYEALAYAPKSWIMDDPAQRVLMMQSAPLVVPFRPDASFSAMVI